MPFLLGAAVLLLGTVWLALRRPAAPDEHSLAVQQVAAGEMGSTDAPARIASQTLTETGKVVVVEIGGRLWTNLIPDTMLSLTDEQLLELAEALAEPPPPRSTPAADTLNKRLLFYGVTLDDQTNLLPSVTITGLVTVARYGGELRHLPVATESGPDGRFEFDIADGQVLMVAADKGPDYIPPPWQWFQYSPMGNNRPIHQPSIAEPVPFVLTKKEEPEPLLELRRGWTARNTGEPVRIDLLTGQVVPTGGDIVVSIFCPEPYKAGDKIPWRLVLEATGGRAGAGAGGAAGLHAPGSGSGLSGICSRTRKGRP
ncbi:MAG: hypothetical protein ACKVYV_04230 [Limisphaerales bacterium]